MEFGVLLLYRLRLYYPNHKFLRELYYKSSILAHRLSVEVVWEFGDIFLDSKYHL